MKASRVANKRSRMKRHELQCRIVQRFARFRISGKEDLKSAIELESVDTIRADTPPDPIGRFKDRAREANRLIIVLFDAGPLQLGAARLVHLALLILLARRAQEAGAELRWGILQNAPTLHEPQGVPRS